jgi:hypothetical protein
MVQGLAWKRALSRAADVLWLRAGVKFAAVLLVLGGLVGSTLHVHHGSGSETCAICVHARTPAEAAPVAASLGALQPAHDVHWTTCVPLAPAPRPSSTDSRAPPRLAPTA